MKKLYLLLSITLLAFLGSGIAWAGYVPTDFPVSEVTEGSLFYIRGDYEAGEEPVWVDVYRWFGVQYPKYTEQDITRFRPTEMNPGETYVFTIEAAPSQVEGTQGYYLKNVMTNSYVVKDTEEGDHLASDLFMTANKEEATVFGFIYANQMYEDLPEETMQIVCYNADSTLVYLNNGYAGDNGFYNPKMADFTDGTTWFSIVLAEENSEEDMIIEQLISMNVQLDNYYPALGGSEPGYYAPELAEEFNAAFVECNVDELLYGGDVDPTIEELRAARDRLEAVAIKILQGPIPVQDGGYYYVTSAYQWVTNPEDVRAISTIAHDIYWSTLDKTNPEYMWHFTKVSKDMYIMTNYKTGENVVTVDNNGKSTTGQDSTKLIYTKSLGGGQYNLILGTNTNNSMHPKGHNNGEGTRGEITGYPGGFDSNSAWRLQTVDSAIIDSLKEYVEREQEALAIHEEMATMVEEIRKSTLAAFEYEVPDDAIEVTPISGDDFQSNAAMSAEHGMSWGEDGQGYAALIDNNYETYFHTSWTGALINSTSYDEEGNPTGTFTTLHNLSMKLTEPVNDVSFLVSARPGNYNNPTKVDVDVSKDGVEWKTVYYGYDFFTPTIDPEDPFIIGPFEFDDSYQYVRFANYLNDRNKSGRFFCISELKVFEGVKLTPTCQASTMSSEVVSAFMKAYSGVNKYSDVYTGDDVEDMRVALDNLKTAYGTFLAQFADPTELKESIKLANNTLTYFRIGEGQVGLYTEDANTEELDNVTEAAQGILDHGYYTQQELDDANTAIKTAMDALNTHLIMPDPEQWYRFQFANAEEFEEFGYTEGEALIDRVCTVASEFVDEVVTFPEDLMNIHGSAALYNAAIEDIPSPDLYYFRFIPVDDGYVLQNKGTGLFINFLPYSMLAHANTQPGFFKLAVLGGGFCVLDSYDLQTGEGREEINTLHFCNPAQYYEIRGWKNHELATKSAIKIVETGEMVSEEEIGVYYRDQEAETAEIVTYNAGISSADYVEMYKVEGQYEDDGLTYIGMTRIETAEAGEPVIILANEELGQIRFNTEISRAGLTVNSLVGTLVNDTVDVDSHAALLNNKGETPKWDYVTKETVIPAGKGYLDGNNLIMLTLDEYEDLEGEHLGWLITAITDGIKHAEGSTPWNAKAVYDLQGRRVANTDNLNSLKQGIYIINGKKVYIP